MGPGLHIVERGAGGGGPLVVLVHGSMDRGASFARAVRHLEGHHVARYDRRGYGRSRTAGPTTDLEGHAADLVGVVRAVAGDGEVAVAVGHSYGGAVALAAAARHPEVIRAVGAFETPLSWLPWWPEDTAGGAALARAAEEDGSGAGAADAFLERMLGTQRWAALPAATRRDRRAEGAALVAELDSLRAAAPFDLGHLPVPVLAGHGTRSTEHHRRSAEHLAAAASAGLVVIEGASHGAHLSHPADFAGFVRQVVDLSGS